MNPHNIDRPSVLVSRRAVLRPQQLYAENRTWHLPSPRSFKESPRLDHPPADDWNDRLWNQLFLPHAPPV